MRKVLVVAPRMIVPALSGGEIRVLSLIRQLAGRYEFSFMTFSPAGEEKRLAASALYLESGPVRKVHLARRSGSVPPRPSALTPDYAWWFHEPDFGRALREVVVRDGIDLVHLEFGEMGQYADAVADVAATVLTEHDAGVLSARRGYHARDPRRGLWSRSRDWVSRLVYEARILGACDRAVAMSQADARRLARLARSTPVRVVPTGVDLEAFSFGPWEEREPDSLVYVGHYPHFPNEDAAVRLCRGVLPRVLALRPGARLSLVGSGPTSAVLAQRSASVEVTGGVPSVAPYLRRARAFLAPLRLGCGIKGKLLEAFACGVPVVASPQACEALEGVEDGRHLLLAGTDAQFAAAAHRLLGDEALGRRLASQARAYVESRFGWAAQASLLDRVYQEALAAAAGRLTE